LPIFAATRVRMGQHSTGAFSTLNATWMDGLRRNDQAVIRVRSMRRHFPAVRQYVLQNSGTVSDAQDVFQEAMVVLWLTVKDGSAFCRVRRPGPAVSSSVWRRTSGSTFVRSAAHKHMKVVHDDRTLDRRIDVPDDIEERIVRLRAVSMTSSMTSAATILDQFYFERKDLATIAATMGVEEESIRTIKYRCMMKLRAFRTVISGEDSEAS
jgi:DNA-directed RNA polymerase specialized sigma24 family protein